MARAPKAFEMQDPHSLAGKREGNLEIAIGREVREFRRKLDMTVAELARLAGMSAGMLSKIENGMTSPSLDTLQSLSTALHVPVTAFFRRYEEERDATFVKAGQGLNIERRGTRAGPSVPAARPFAAPAPGGRALSDHADRGFRRLPAVPA